MLKKDLFELCLLHLLAEQDLYGYEILRLLYAQFPDTQESSIYAILRNLCQKHYLGTYTSEVSNGPTRKYYCITEKGRERLGELLKKWHFLLQAMQELGIE